MSTQTYQYIGEAAKARIFANKNNRDDQIKYSLELTSTGPKRTPVAIIRYGVVSTEPKMVQPDNTTDPSLATLVTKKVSIDISGAYGSIDEVLAHVDHVVTLFKAGQAAAKNKFLPSMNAEPSYETI